MCIRSLPAKEIFCCPFINVVIIVPLPLPEDLLFIELGDRRLTELIPRSELVTTDLFSTRSVTFSSFSSFDDRRYSPTLDVLLAVLIVELSQLTLRCRNFKSLSLLLRFSSSDSNSAQPIIFFWLIFWFEFSVMIPNLLKIAKSPAWEEKLWILSRWFDSVSNSWLDDIVRVRIILSAGSKFPFNVPDEKSLLPCNIRRSISCSFWWSLNFFCW